jgi:hypothetical protein
MRSTTLRRLTSTTKTKISFNCITTAKFRYPGSSGTLTAARTSGTGADKLTPLPLAVSAGELNYGLHPEFAKECGLTSVTVSDPQTGSNPADAAKKR